MINQRNSKTVKLLVVNNASEALREKPAILANDISLTDAITKLYDDIINMKANGYDWSAITDTLKSNGIVIQIATLRAYVYAIKRRRKAEGEGKIKAAV